MNAKHTPGKWQVETAVTSRDGKTCITEYFVRRDGDGMAIANDITDPETETMSEANARLIAASPDLLEALHQFVSVCKTSPPMDLMQNIGLACEAAESAIAKATQP